MPVIEIVRFNTPKEANDQAIIAADKRIMNEYSRKQKGFISQQTARASNGEWLVVVQWQTIADAEASLKKFPGEPLAQNFMQMIDASTMKMDLYTVC